MQKAKLNNKKGFSAADLALTVPTFFSLKSFVIDQFGPSGKWASVSSFVFVPLLVGVALFLFVVPNVRRAALPTLAGLSILVGGAFFARQSLHEAPVPANAFKPRAFVANTPVNDKSNHTLHELIVKGPSAFVGGVTPAVYNRTLSLLIRKASSEAVNREYQGLTPLFYALLNKNKTAFDLLMKSGKVNAMRACYLPEMTEGVARKAASIIPFLGSFFQKTPLDLAISQGDKAAVEKLLPVYKRANYAFSRGSQVRPLEALGFNTKELKVREDIKEARRKKMKAKVKASLKQSKSVVSQAFQAIGRFFKAIWSAISGFFKNHVAPLISSLAPKKPTKINVK